MSKRNRESDAARLRRLLCLASASASASIISFSAARGSTDTATWGNSTSTWSSPGNWTHSNASANGTIPNNSASFTYDAVIAGGSLTQDIAAGVTINGLFLNGGALALDHVINVNTDANWTDTALAGAASISLGAASTFTINGTGDKALSTTIVNSGVATWSDGRIDVSSGTFTNNGTFDDIGTSTFEFFAGTNAFNNNGTFNRNTSTGSTNFDITFNNNAAVGVNAGTLALNAGGTNNGSILIATGAALRFGGGSMNVTHSVAGSGTAVVEFSGGTTTFALGSLFTNNGTGTTIFDGGDVVINAANTILTNLNMSAGTLEGSASISVTNSGSWTGGTMAGSGTTNLGSSVNTTAAAPGDLGLARTLINAGTFTWTGGRFDVLNGTFVNNGTMDIQANNTFETFGGTNLFSNNGGVKRDVGTGTALFNIPFNNNSGSVTVSTGTLQLNGGGTNNGAYIVNTGADLNFSGGTNTFIGLFSGNGTLTFSGGMANLNTSLALGTGTVDFTGAFIGGSSTLTISHWLNWTAGTQGGLGTTVLANTSTLAISGTADKGLSRAVIDSGVATWSDGRLNVNGGTFTNNGTFDDQANNIFEFFGGNNAFNNNGIFTRDVGAGSSNFNTPFNNGNAGSVTVSTGTLALNLGGASSGAFTVNGTADLRFGGGTQTITAGHLSSASTSTIEFSNGTTILNSTSTYTNSGTTAITGGDVQFNMSSVTAGNLIITAGDLDGSATFNVIGNTFNWTAGGMLGSGTTVLGTGVTSSAPGPGDMTLERTLINTGTFNWSAGRFDLLNGTFVNNSTFDDQANNTFETFGGTNSFNNNSIFKRDLGAATTQFNVPFNNSGSVAVSTGTLVINAGGTDSGSFSVAAGADINFSNGTNTFNAPGSSISGSGTTTFSGGSAVFNGNYNLSSATVDFSGATIAGSGTLNLSHWVNWTAGFQFDTGTTILSSLTTLSISGAGDKGLDRMVIDSGVATWTAGRFDVNAGTFTNNGSFDGQANDIFEIFGPNDAFNNNGFFTRDVGTGSENFNIPFNNAGTVTISTGTLSLNGGGNSSGTFNVTAAGAELRFGGGTQTVTGGKLSAVFNSSIEFSNGTTSLGASTVFTNSGTTVVSGGIATLSNSGTTSGLTLSAGQIGSAATFTVTGTGSWTGGGLVAAGTTLFGNNSNLTVTGANDKTLATTVVSNGAATWTAGRFNVNAGTFINNGTFDGQADNTFEFFGGANAFTNNGHYTRDTGSLTQQFNIPFNNAGTTTVSTGTLLLNAGGSSSGTFIINSGTTLKTAGTHTLGAASSITGTGTLQVPGGGTVSVAGAYNVANTIINGGGTIRLASGTNRVLRTNNLQFDGNATAGWAGQLDLNDGDAIIDYTGASPYANVKSQIKQGYNNTNWNGAGIAASQGNSTHFAVGYEEASSKFSVFPATFDGFPIDNTTLLIKYTYYGDTNLDGKVDVTDLGVLASHWQQTGDWLQGDFNYDGSVNVTDLGLLASNWQNGVGNPLGPDSFQQALDAVGLGNVSVPEPIELALLLPMLLATQRPRRRENGPLGRRSSKASTTFSF